MIKNNKSPEKISRKNLYLQKKVKKLKKNSKNCILLIKKRYH